MIVYLAFVLAPAVAMGGLSLALLWRAGELHDVRRIPALQQQTHAVYGSATHENFYAYKLALAEVRHPRIVAMGSSRVMQLRQSSFRVRFANLGGAMRNVPEGESLARDLVAQGRPDVAIIGVDFWWFNPSLDEQQVFADHSDYRPALLPSLVLPTRWTLQGTIAPEAWWRILGGEPTGPEPTIGLLAAVTGEGYRPDGSYRIRRRDTFDGALQRIRSATGGFERARSFDAGRLARFSALVRSLEGQGISVVTFVAPFPTAVLSAMDAKGGYTFLDELRRELFRSAQHHYDFLDPTTLGSSDQEFFDGLHGGEIVYLRALQRMSADPKCPLRGVLHLDRIVPRIEGHTGLPFLPEEAGTGDPEDEAAE